MQVIIKKEKHHNNIFVVFFFDPKIKNKQVLRHDGSQVPFKIKNTQDNIFSTYYDAMPF